MPSRLRGRNTTASPTIVLVHGAFTDASIWWPVALRLLGSGWRVLAPPVGLRSFAGDCAYIRATVERIDGPVLLVGHGYGGAIVSVAGAATNVVGLVFVAAYVLDAGESIAQLRDGFPDTDLNRHVVGSYFRDDAGAPGTELTVAVDAFADVLAEGLPSDETSVLAISQRPIAVTALSEQAEADAWRRTRSWGIVASADRAVNPELQRFGYRRAHCRVEELDGPHFLPQTHAADLVRIIGAALIDISEGDIT